MFRMMIIIVSLFLLPISNCRTAPTCPASQTVVQQKNSLPTISIANPMTGGNTNPQISITGLVRQPINLTLRDLKRFIPAELRLNDVKQNGNYQGVFIYQGVPLRTLLEQAVIEKEEAIFGREIDLAIVVRNRNGKQVLFSWGEIFYRNAGETLLAYDGSPLMPHRACSQCHRKDEMSEYYNALFRKVSFPKIVTSRDFYTDRCLEQVVAIEVVDLGRYKGIQRAKKDRPQKLYAPSVAISKQDGTESSFQQLPEMHRISVKAIMAGEGIGYHGLRNYEGISLRELLSHNGFNYHPGQAFVLSAPDGYRVLISSAELFAIPGGYRIIIADQESGKSIQEDGRFKVILPDDLSADRWLKAVAQIDMVQAQREAHLYVIGVGPADTKLITLEAISTLAKSDVVIAAQDIYRRFKKYIGEKENLYDPLAPITDASGKPRIPDAKTEKKLHQNPRESEVRAIKKALKEGKTIAFLDYGDPTIFGIWRFLEGTDIPRSQITLIPGLSSANVGTNLLGRDITNAGALIVTTPTQIENDPALARAIAKGGETVALLVSLSDINRTDELIRTYWSTNAKAVVVYKAGYRDSEKVIRTTVGELKNIADRETEKHLGIIYLGAHL